MKMGKKSQSPLRQGREFAKDQGPVNNSLPMSRLQIKIGAKTFIIHIVTIVVNLN